LSREVGELVQTTAGKWITHPPTHCPDGHTLGPGEVLVELTEETALALADAIYRAIDSAPTGLASKDQ
jgi:hypothetical protein